MKPFASHRRIYLIPPKVTVSFETYSDYFWSLYE